jgi:hypothetical protein
MTILVPEGRTRIQLMVVEIQNMHTFYRELILYILIESESSYTCLLLSVKKHTRPNAITAINRDQKKRNNPHPIPNLSITAEYTIVCCVCCCNCFIIFSYKKTSSLLMTIISTNLLCIVVAVYNCNNIDI